MRRATIILLALWITGSVTAVASMKVQISEKPGVDFSTYETYTWKRRTDLHPDHPMATGSELDTWVRGLANDQMAAKGFELVNTEKADLWLNYVTYDSDVLQIEGTTKNVAKNVKWIGDPYAHSMRNYLEGTLIIEVVDAKTGKMLWSGWASDAAATQEKLQGKAPKAIKKIFQHFPPD